MKKALHHICIQTSNYDASIDFYTKIMEFKIIKESKNFHNRAFNTWLEYNNFFIELQTEKNGEVFEKYNKNSDGLVHFCLYVRDIESEYQRIKNLGFNKFSAKNGKDIYEVEDGQLFKIKAPEGTIIEIRNTWMI
jgi:glyoxylase I family protein